MKKIINIIINLLICIMVCVSVYHISLGCKVIERTDVNPDCRYPKCIVSISTHHSTRKFVEFVNMCNDTVVESIHVSNMDIYTSVCDCE